VVSCAVLLLEDLASDGREIRVLEEDCIVVLHCVLLRSYGVVDRDAVDRQGCCGVQLCGVPKVEGAGGSYIL
jgi:hypothetical protein